MYVFYTDIEIKFEPSDEEFTDSVGKLKSHLKETKYVLVMFIAVLDGCDDRNGDQSLRYWLGKK